MVPGKLIICLKSQRHVIAFQGPMFHDFPQLKLKPSFERHGVLCQQIFVCPMTLQAWMVLGQKSEGIQCQELTGRNLSP